MATKHLSRQQAKDRLGDMPERSFARLVSEGLPREGDGASARFPWPEIFHWYMAREREAGRKQAKPGAPELLDADRRERVARADLAQLKADEARGLVVSKAAYRAEQEVVARALRAAVLGLPGRHADQVLGLTTRPRAIQALQGVARQLLEALQHCLDAAPPLPDQPQGTEGAA